MCGRFFEEETKTILCLLSDDNMRLKFSSVSGLVPVLKTEEPSKSKTMMDWRIVEKNFPIFRNTGI